MRIFKVLNEIKWFLKYQKAIDLLETHPLWTTYRFSRGWIGQIGTVVRVNKHDIAGNLEIDSSVEKMHIIEYLRPFIDVLTSTGITSDVIRPVIKGRFGADELAMSSKYLFYNVSFWFFFKELNSQYIISRLIFISLLIFGITNHNKIFNLIQGIF